MNDKNEAVFKWDWQKTIKLGVVIIVILYLLKAIYSISIANDDLRQVGDLVAKQKTQFESLQKQSDVEIRKVQDGLANGANEIENTSHTFSNKMNDFAKDFNESLQAELDRREARHRKNFIHDFLEAHVTFYDANLYETDRQKAIEKRHYPLPDYKQYSKMRETVMHCHMQFHNKTEETIYRNKIAQLKADHHEKLVRSVPKPDIWQWPLTLKQLTQIQIDHYNLIFSMITPEGQCRYG